MDAVRVTNRNKMPYRLLINPPPLNPPGFPSTKIVTNCALTGLGTKGGKGVAWKLTHANPHFHHWSTLYLVNPKQRAVEAQRDV